MCELGGVFGAKLQLKRQKKANDGVKLGRPLKHVLEAWSLPDQDNTKLERRDLVHPDLKCVDNFAWSRTVEWRIAQPKHGSMSIS